MGALGDAWERLKKDAETIKKTGFKTNAAAAEERVKANREQHGTQLQEDMKLSPEERAAKVRKGFLKRIGE